MNNINEANIDITRIGGKLISIAVVMPKWDRLGMDSFIHVDIPFFNIKTFSANDADIDIAVQEAIHAFCLTAEKFGKGLENELRSIGWTDTFENGDVLSMSYTVPENSVVIDQIMQTGEQYAHTQVLEAA